MDEFHLPTHHRPAVGVAEIPVHFHGKLIALGVILRDGTFAFEISDADLIAMITNGSAQVIVTESNGHYSSEIWLYRK